MLLQEKLARAKSELVHHKKSQPKSGSENTATQSLNQAKGNVEVIRVFQLRYVPNSESVLTIFVLKPSLFS